MFSLEPVSNGVSGVDCKMTKSSATRPCRVIAFESSLLSDDKVCAVKSIHPNFNFNKSQILLKGQGALLLDDMSSIHRMFRSIANNVPSKMA